MSTTTKSTTKAPALLTADAGAEVREALLRLASANYADAAMVEAHGTVPPVATERVTYRRGPLEVEALGWSAGGASVSQTITLWVPARTEGKRRELTERTGRGEYVNNDALGLEHANLEEVTRATRQAKLSDGTTVITGTYAVTVFPLLPLIPDRTEETVRAALGHGRNGRQVGKIHPVQGALEHHTQRVELGVVTVGSVHPLLRDLGGTSTSAGYVSSVEADSSRPDVIGEGSYYSATPSREHVVTALVVTLSWRER